MRRTFPSFGLKSVIRLCAFVLTLCVMMNSERSFATVTFNQKHGAANDSVRFTICPTHGNTYALDSLLAVTDIALGNITWYQASGISDASLSLPTAVSPTSGSSAGGTDIRGHITYTVTAGTTVGLTYFKVGVTTTAGGSVDTIVVVVNRPGPPSFSSIAATYDVIYDGAAATFTDAIAGGTWSLANGTTDASLSASGTSCTVSAHWTGLPVVDSVIYYANNGCGVIADTTFAITVIAAALPMTPSSSPTITSIDMAYGIPGTSFTLKGQRFDVVPGKNIVFFGGTQAVVASGSGDSVLNVTVPYGATYDRITVLDTVTHLTGSIRQPFTPTWDNCAFNSGTDINLQIADSIILSGGVASGASGVIPYSIELADLDGDGKLDMVVTGTDASAARAGNVYIYRNISSAGTVDHTSFASSPTIIYTHPSVGGRSSLYNVKMLDLDGDGKKEVIASSPTTSRIYVWKNYSTPGSLSFYSSTDSGFYIDHVGYLPTEISVVDYNNDGRPDIGVVSVGTVNGQDGASATTPGGLYVVQNNYSRRRAGGNTINASDFSVTHVYDYPIVTSHPVSLCSADFDGDGMLDIAVADHYGRNFKVFHNTSTTASLAFDNSATPVSTAVATTAGSTGITARAGYPNQIRTGDFNKDGYQEIVVAVSDSDLLTGNLYNKIAVFSNATASSGGISFGSPAYFTTGVAPVGIAIVDLDGDTRQDIVVTNSGAGSVSIIKNTSSGGAINFASHVDDTIEHTVPGSIGTVSNSGVKGGPVTIAVGDIDNNSVPDFVVVSREQNMISIVRNAPIPVTNQVIGSDSICIGSTITVHSGRPNCTRAAGFWHASNTNVTISGVTAGIADTNANLTANALGLDTVYYTVVSLNDSASVMKIFRIVDTAHLVAISGPTQVCVGDTINLSITGTSGGTWSTSAASIASIVSAATSTPDSLVGIAPGSVVVTYTTSTPACPSIVRNHNVTVNALPHVSPISGTTTVCNLASTTLADTAVTGTVLWTSLNTGKATVGATSGVVTGVDTGAVTIKYRLTNSCGMDSTTTIVTVNPLAHASVINSTTTDTVCVGSTRLYTDSVSGGTWISSNTTVATVSTGGVVTGVGTGTARISYAVSNSCGVDTANKVVHVIAPLSLPTLTGDSVCVGSNVTYTASVAGGTWSSANTSFASVADSTIGVIHGVAAGSTTITYTSTNFCGTIAATRPITVNALPNAGTIDGAVVGVPDSICSGTSVTFTSTGDAGGTWTSSDTSVATVSSGGVVTGVVTTGASATITYHVNSIHGCTPATATRNIYVKPNAVPGTVTGPTNMCQGDSSLFTASGAAGGTWSVISGGGSITSTGMYTAGGGNPFGGTSVVEYTATNSCGPISATASVTVRTAPTVNPIAGPTSVCTGLTITESATNTTGPGGSVHWSSSNTAIANLTTSATSTTGVTLMGVAQGTITLKDSAVNACGTTIRTATITVNQSPNAGVVTGPSQVCVGAVGVYFSIIGGTDSTGGIWDATHSSGHIATSFTAGAVADTEYINIISAGRAILCYTNTNSCGSSTNCDTFNVNRQPRAGGDSATVKSVCPGNTVTFNADPSAFATIWVSADTTIAITSASGSALDTVTGVRPGFVTIYNIDSNFCGTDTALRFVHVNSPSPTPGIVFGQDSICKGLPFTFADTTADTTAGVGVWAATPSTVAAITGTTATTINLSAIGSGVATISYTVTNLCGANTATKNIQVNDFPQLTSATSANVCDSLVFNYSPTADSTGATFTWIRPSASGIANPADSFGVNAISEYLDNTTNTNEIVTYHYTISKHGCVSNPDLTVTVKPTPYLTSVKNFEVCSGSQFTYVDSTSVNGTLATWTRAGGVGHIVSPTTAGSGTNNIVETLTSDTLMPIKVPYVYHLNANGCVNTATVTALVDPRPTYPQINTKPNGSDICEGTMYMNFGSIINPSGTGVNYAWTASNATIWATGSTKQYCLVNFDKGSGDAYIYLLATLPGYTCASKDSAYIHVNSSIAEQPNVIWWNGDFVCTSNIEDSYQWGYDDKLTLDSATFPYETNQNYTNISPDLNGKWYWVITKHNGCEQKTYYITPTGVKNVTASMGDVRLYPNPAQQYLNVEVSNTSGGKYTVDVVDMLGKQVSNHNLVGGTVTINVADLASGVYFVDCYRDGVKFATEKFVKN